VIYLDSNVLIRLIEGDHAARNPIERRLAPEPQFITSQLSRLECRCRPMRDANATLLGLYDAAFSARELRLIELDAQVIDQATTIRATQNLKAPDALHLATALVSGATVFLTGDKQLTRFTQIKVELI
jgi:predicted nucleic acid-binding protein